MSPPPPRHVTLVLADPQGQLLGALPPFEATTPWWMDLAPVVQAVWARHHLRVLVLRLLASELPAAHGGAVTYLAQLADDLPGGDAQASGPLPTLQPWPGTLTDDPLRHAYARPGGPQADLAWAAAQLQAQGRPLAGRPQQIRSWNLSGLWCLPCAGGLAWLKVVPPFFAHEGPLLAALGQPPGVAGVAVPRLLAWQGGRLLLDHLPGEDLYGADAAIGRQMVDRLVGLQAAWLGRAEALIRLGLPDWRGPALRAALHALLQRRGAELTAAEHGLLARFIAELPARVAALAACGLPDGLVHGDFHPGNLRGQLHPTAHPAADAPAPALALLDWGDSGVGHPLLDQAAFLSRIAPVDVAAVQAHWAAAWRRVRPQAQPERAATLLAPLASARQALVYQGFLDGIEASEQAYHQADVLACLQRTAALLAPD